MTELDFPLSGDDQEDKFPGDDRQEPQKPNEQWVIDENYEQNHRTAKRLAFFIMGCLVQEQVVQLGKTHGDVMSDFEVGLSLITECLCGNLIEDDLPQLPFDWRCE